MPLWLVRALVNIGGSWLLSLIVIIWLVCRVSLWASILTLGLILSILAVRAVL